MFAATPYLSRLSLLVARSVALCGAVLSAWMLYLSFKYVNVSVNWGDSACIDAAKTRWGYWMKMPIALPGLVVYLAITALSFRLKPWDDRVVEDKLWPVLIVLVTIAAAAGFWLLGAQAALLRYLCPHCMIINLCGMLLFFIFVFLMRSHPWTLAFSMVGAGLILLVQVVVGPPSPKMAKKSGVPSAPMPAGSVDPEPDPDPLPVFDPLERPPNTDISHIIFSEDPDGLEDPFGSSKQPLTFVPIVSSLEGVDTNAAPKAAAVESQPRSLQELLDEEESQATSSGFRRTHVTLGSGKIYLKLDEAPFIGSTKAPKIIAVMYDYTMPDCVKMLQFLRQQVVRYNGVIGVALLPTPIDHDCNVNLRWTPEKYRGACDYARTSLEVWLTNPAEHLEFELFVTKGKHATPLHQVQWLGERLVDRDALSPTDLERQIQRQIGRNASFWEDLDFGTLPKLIFEGGVTMGTPQIPEDMDLFMEGQLGFKPGEIPANRTR